MSAWVNTRTPSRSVSRSGSASALRSSSVNAMLSESAIVVGSPSRFVDNSDGNHAVAVPVKAGRPKPHTSVDSTAAGIYEAVQERVQADVFFGGQIQGRDSAAEK